MKVGIGTICEVEGLIRDGWKVHYKSEGLDMVIRTVKQLRTLYLMTTRVLVYDIDYDSKVVEVSPHESVMGVD